jgi:hypothetical protein
VHRRWRATAVAALLAALMLAPAEAVSEVRFAESTPMVVTAGKPAPVMLVNNTDPAWKPLVDSWRITNYRGPILHGLHNTTVPLAENASCGATATEVVGGVGRASGGTATVAATCRPGETSVHLSVSGLDEAGDYTGKVDLAVDAPGSELTLTVRNTDDVVYPALLLLAGIILALLAAWQSGRLTTLSRAREETFLIEADAASAHQRFRAAGGEAAREKSTWQGYSFMTSLQNRLESVRKRLRGLRWLFSEIDVEKGPYKEQLDVLAELRTLVDAWEPFATRLAALATARSAVTKDPPLARHADDLLQGHEIATTDQVRPLIEDAVQTEAALLGWPADDHTVRKLLELGASLGTTIPAGRGTDRLIRAVTKVEQVRDDMWSAADGTAYTALDVAGRLEEPETELAALRRQYLGTLSGREAEEHEPEPPERVTARPHSWDVVRETATARARRAALSRRLRNSLAFAAIAAVTVWTGLTALYFDKPFGTWRDYTAALVWGFGAQAALTALAGALDRIIEGGSVVRS